MKNTKKNISKDDLLKFKQVDTTCGDLALFLKDKYFGEMIDGILHSNCLKYFQDFLDVRYPDYKCKVTDVTDLSVERGEIWLKVEALEQSLVIVLK